MSHGGGGGGGGVGHHGGGHHSGGEPDQSASWNMAYVGEKRTGLMANFSPAPIFIGLIVFTFMLLPFVMDWNEPHLQRLLLGHDLTPKEIEHDNAVNQVMAGLMRSKVNSTFGHHMGDSMISDPEPSSGSDLIGQPQAPGSMPEAGAQPSGGLNGFSISADSPPQQGYTQSATAQPDGLSSQMAPAQNYMQNYAQPNTYPAMAPQSVPPTVGFSNQRFVSQPSRGSYPGAGAGAASGIDCRAARHKVVVER